MDLWQLYGYASLALTFFFFILGIESSLYFILGVIVSLYVIKFTVLKTQQDKLQQANENLAALNEVYEETVQHIMAQYRRMDSFSASKSPKMIIEEITHSLKKCMKSEAAFFWLTAHIHQNSIITATCAPYFIEAELKRKWIISGERKNRLSIG